LIKDFNSILDRLRGERANRKMFPFWVTDLNPNLDSVRVEEGERVVGLVFYKYDFNPILDLVVWRREKRRRFFFWITDFNPILNMVIGEGRGGRRGERLSFGYLILTLF
jgi:hypothetical protein